MLKDWGIDGKIFSLTFDNVSSNDSMQNILKERLNLQNGLLCDGDFFSCYMLCTYIESHSSRRFESG